MEIVGWAIGETLETGHCIHALRMAVKRVNDTSGKNSFITQTEDVNMPVKNIHLY